MFQKLKTAFYFGSLVVTISSEEDGQCSDILPLALDLIADGYLKVKQDLQKWKDTGIIYQILWLFQRNKLQRSLHLCLLIPQVAMPCFHE